MRGEVLYFDRDRGIGFISGSDGNRYHFDRADLSGRTDTAKGERVEFLTAGNRAQSVVSLEALTAPPPGRESRPSGSAVVPRVQRSADGKSPTPGQSLFAYFRTCITSRYATFRGRARRKEYWGFLLFYVLTVIGLSIMGVLIDASIGNLDREEPVFTSTFAVLGVVSMMLPSVAVTVRRIHDIGLSGWFVLLGLIPSVGNLIILVFALIPSQKQANRWGEAPAGCRKAASTRLPG